MSVLNDIEAALLSEGFVCVDDVGEFQLYADTVGGGLDIIYQPATNSLYVCGKGGQMRIFPIQSPETAIRSSRYLASKTPIPFQGTGCTD